jgi:AraC-like DNA-binding protein
MIYRETAPARHLKPYVKCFWELEYASVTRDPECEPVLPDGCPEIVFNLSDRFIRIHDNTDHIQPASILAGQMTRNITIRPSGNVKLFGVRLQPAGASPMLAFPMHEITDQIVDFTAATGEPGRDVEDRINDARQFGDRVAIFEEYLTSRLLQGCVGDPVALRASEMMMYANGLTKVASVAEALGVSDRRLERAFKRAIGVSPKTYSKVVRFQTMLRTFQSHPNSELLDTALACGYYDQSHLTRDFREFAGSTPIAFFSRRHQISDVFTGTGDL